MKDAASCEAWVTQEGEREGEKQEDELGPTGRGRRARRDTSTTENAPHVCVCQKQPGWGKPHTTVPEQQKDQGTVWCWQTATERLKTLNAVCGVIKSSLGEVQTKAGNYNRRLG